MRHTAKKMPGFAADFDGAALRHQLYSFALTHFQPIFINYFVRSDPHKLHNRSVELWSPLVALVAFFEEPGGVSHLLSATSNAASWDNEVSEGQSLGERDEAVLQALDLMTRHTTQIVWIMSDGSYLSSWGQLYIYDARVMRRAMRGFPGNSTS